MIVNGPRHQLLPVPESPPIKTAASVAASRPIRLNISRIATGAEHSNAFGFLVLPRCLGGQLRAAWLKRAARRPDAKLQLSVGVQRLRNVAS